VAKLCFYCRRERARTQEHIFGTQFARVLADDPNFHVPTETKVAQRDGPVLRTLIGKVTKRGHPTIEFVTKVGANCNSGWMGLVDDRAAPVLTPMIRGHHTTIEPNMRALLAAWATKTALSGRSITEPPQVIAHEWADTLRSTQLPIPGWHVWIGVFDGNPSYFFHCSDGPVSRYEVTANGPVRRDEASAHSVRACFVIGHLAVQVFGPTSGETLGINMNPAALISIWPSDGASVAWPTARAIGPDTVWNWVDALNGRPLPTSE
jgi:hypothetical protein